MFPATASAEGALFNVPPFLATLREMTCYTGSGRGSAVSRQSSTFREATRIRHAS
jgi:hypothetical protein